MLIKLLNSSLKDMNALMMNKDVIMPNKNNNNMDIFLKINNNHKKMNNISIFI